MQDDSEILEIFHKNGEHEMAFNLIVRKYGKRLYWHLRELVASHDDADDLLQATFIKAWRNLPRFRGESTLFTWLYRIATNEALTFLKRERKKTKFSLTPFEARLSERLTSTEDFSGDTIQLALQKRVMELPDKQRAIFSLRYFQEMEYAEIAEITNSNIGAVKASYSVAYNKISKSLKEEF